MVHSDKWFLQSIYPPDKCIQFEISKPALQISILDIGMKIIKEDYSCISQGPMS